MKNKKVLLLLVLLLMSLTACLSQTQEEPISEEMPPEVVEVSITKENVSVPVLDDNEPEDSQDSSLAQPSKEVNLPRALVEGFYQWYFNQPGEAVLVQRSYQNHPVLSDIFVSDVGYLLDSFKDKSGYDPFTCSQTILPGFIFDPVFVSGGEAYVMGQVVEEGETRHYLVVQLGTGEGEWKIDAIHCPFEPETPAIAFYTGYLGHISGGQDIGLGIDPINPYKDGFWEQFFVVSENFRSEISGLLAERDADAGGSDPVLLAQTLPQGFWVNPGQEGPDIRVRLTFGPYSERYYNLHLAESALLTWQVDGIEMDEIPAFDAGAKAEVSTDDWQILEDQDYGVSFKFPQEWRSRLADLSSIPSDDACKKGYFLFPSWASDDLPALWVNILEGTEADVMNYYVIESHQSVQVNGQNVWVDRAQCDTRFVFQHPNQENVWLVIGDTCPGMSGREAYFEALESALAPLLRTVTFSQE